MAFHLGCLQTLDRLGILERTSVLSTVSGGSVIGAMYMVHDGTFEEFEACVREVLSVGFMRPAVRTAFGTMEGVRAATCAAVLVTTGLALIPFWIGMDFLTRLVGEKRQGRVGIAPEKWATRRFASRTTILRHTFDTLLFKGRTLGSLPVDGPAWIAVATELQTHSAFYFGRRDAGSWRFGQMDPSKTLVAHAVAASAAYPMMLPALDEFLTFRKADGSLVRERVTLTDGGVYDNLGLAPLWPDRDPKISIGVRKIDVIVACRAGYGLRKAEPSIFIFSRMKAVFGCISDRAQNASMTRLFDLKAAGRIRTFALPYIDQDDNKLAYPPADLVSRTAVADYPTDFSAMRQEWIEKLSKRGEQLTLAVIKEHAVELMSNGGRKTL